MRDSDTAQRSKTTDKPDIITVNNVSDFDLAHIFECGQCFRWVPCGSGYTGAASDKAAFVSFEDGTVTLDATGGSEAFWRSYFDLSTDYGEIKSALCKNEPGIKAAADHGCGIRILRQDPFETIISFIISQNNNIPRIRKNIEALCEKYGSVIEGSAELLKRHGAEGRECMYSFPSASSLAAASEDDLAALRLGYRGPYIIATAKKYLEDGCPQCREQLLSCHGIGPKVANCIMLFGLRDTAAFPIDTWVKQIMNDMYGFELSDTKGMQAFASEHFGDLAGYAQQYLFYYYRSKASGKQIKG